MSTCPQKEIDILGIGASTLDRFIVVDHYPTGREVQQVVSSTTDGGGPVATALAVAGKYGARTAMIDSIGDDMVGRHILDDFKKIMLILMLSTLKREKRVALLQS